MIPVVNLEICKGCGQCEEACPSNAIFLEDELAHIKRELCEECGECVKVCKEGAIILPK